MSKTSCDMPGHQPSRGPVFFSKPVDLPGAPPPSPSGRVLYENLGIRIDRDGVWYYHGSAILRKELICLFAGALTRDQSGRYWLVTPAEMGPIDVEDAPFLAVELFHAGSDERQKISLRTNVDEIVTIDDVHPLMMVANGASGERVPYIRLDKGLEARLTRPVHYELVTLGLEVEIEGRKCLGVWSCGHLFPLGDLDDAL